MEWQKFSFTFEQFSDPSNSKQVALLNLPAKNLLRDIFVYPTSPFSGGNITRFQVSVGPEGNQEKNFSKSDVGQDPMDNYYGAMSAPANAIGSYTDPVPTFVHALSIGDTLDKLESGAFDLYANVVELPA